MPKDFSVDIPESEPIVEETFEAPVRIKEFVFKPMSTDEAILQMNMLGHQFFVFLNEKTEKMNVVYLRKDGHYGLIVPKEN
jgi:putative sigma-54 modulation protein